MREFIDYAKSRQGKLNMASAGVGSQSHLYGTALTLAAGFQSLHVPYKGGGASMGAVVSGEAQWTFPPAAAVMSLAKAGRVRALAHSLPQRSPLLGDIPAIAETVPGFSAVVVSGLLAPKGTPRRIVDKVNATVAKVVRTREFRDQFASQGAEVTTGTPDEFRKAIQHETVELGKAIKAVGLKAE